MKWIQVTCADIITAKGIARAVSLKGRMRNIYFLRRVGGPNDSTIPRWVAGLGETHAEAMEDVVREVARYDRRAQVIWADDEAHPAHNERSRPPLPSPTK